MLQMPLQFQAYALLDDVKFVYKLVFEMRLAKLSTWRFARGDIGPIADDIPSIFPIVFGVLLFMGTAIYTTQKIDERNQYLELRKAGVGLSYVVLRSGYLSDDDFDASCGSQYSDYAARRHVSFLVSLKKYCNYVTLNQSAGGDIFSNLTNYPPAVDCPTFDPNCKPLGGPLGISRTGKTCPALNSDSFPRVKDSHNALKKVSQSNPPPNFQTFTFPVSVQCSADGTVKGAGLANIIVWK